MTTEGTANVNSDPEPWVDLCLSGGGFRATLFHLGVVRLLLDAGLLTQVRHIHSVSGGSILAAHLVSRWPDYVKSGETFRETAKELIRLAQSDLRGAMVWRSYRSPTNLLETYYSSYLFGPRRLKDLKGQKRPALWLLATNLTMGTQAFFDADGLHPNIAKPENLIKSEDQPLALAVAASSAFSAFFPPVRITPERLQVSKGDFGNDVLFLTDGGVYDNLGLRALHAARAAGAADPAIVSDASLGFDWSRAGREPKFVRVIKTAWRSFDIASHRLYELDKTAFTTANVVIIPISLEVDNSSGPVLPGGVQRQLQYVRTDFDKFSDAEVTALVQHGYETARHTLARSPRFQKLVEKTLSEPLWNPLRATEANSKADREIDAKTLYASRDRQVSGLVARIVAVLVAIAGLLAAGWYWWSRPVIPASMRARVALVNSPGDNWLSNHRWLEPQANGLSVEGRGEVAAGRAADYQVLRIEFDPFARATPGIDIPLSAGPNQLRVVAFRARYDQGTWFEPLVVNSAKGPLLQVPPSQAGDLIIAIALEMTGRVGGLVQPVNKELHLVPLELQKP